MREPDRISSASLPFGIFLLTIAVVILLVGAAAVATLLPSHPKLLALGAVVLGPVLLVLIYFIVEDVLKAAHRVWR